MAALTNPFSDEQMDMLRRVNFIPLERSDQAGGMCTGRTGMIFGLGTPNPPDRLKGKMYKITKQQPVIDGIEVTMVLSTDSLSPEEIIKARLAFFPSFWDEFGLPLLSDWTQGEDDVGFLIFVGMLSPWASTYVIKAVFDTFKDDPKNLETYLPVLVFGYLKQPSIFYNLEHTPEMDKALEDIGYFVNTQCIPFIQARYAEVMTKRAEQQAKRAKVEE